MTLSVRAQLKLAEWKHNLEILAGQMADLVSEMFDLNQRTTKLQEEVKSCGGATAVEIVWIEESTKRLGRMNYALKKMQFRLDCMKLQQSWYEGQLTYLENREAKLVPSQNGTSTNGSSPFSHFGPGPFKFIGADKPLGVTRNGHVKNPNQVAQSAADREARGLSVTNGKKSGQKKSGRKDSKDRNPKGKKARKAAAMQAA